MLINIENLRNYSDKVRTVTLISLLPNNSVGLD